MTNETIIDKNTPLEMVVFEYKKTLDLMDLARADEREKLSIEIDDLKSEIERLNSALESRKFIGG